MIMATESRSEDVRRFGGVAGVLSVRTYTEEQARARRVPEPFT